MMDEDLRHTPQELSHEPPPTISSWRYVSWHGQKTTTTPPPPNKFSGNLESRPWSVCRVTIEVLCHSFEAGPS